jgi:small ligand-binding sensory domain FIST
MSNLIHINSSEESQVKNSVSTEIIAHALNTLRTEEEKLIVLIRKQAYQERLVRDLAHALDSVLNMVDTYKMDELCTDHEEEDEGLSDLSLQHLKDHVTLISDYVRNWADANVETTQDVLAEQRALIARMVEEKA